jgi:hypothetical protein
VCVDGWVCGVCMAVCVDGWACVCLRVTFVFAFVNKFGLGGEGGVGVGEGGGLCVCIHNDSVSSERSGNQPYRQH